MVAGTITLLSNHQLISTIISSCALSMIAGATLIGVTIKFLFEKKLIEVGSITCSSIHKSPVRCVGGLHRLGFVRKQTDCCRVVVPLVFHFSPIV